MKNQLATLLFLLLGASSLHSQTTPVYGRQVGIDAAGLLGQIIGSGSGGGSAFYFSYRKLGEKGNRRFGLGASLNLTGGNGSTTTANSFNVRMGNERFLDFGQRWRAFYGWDFRLHFSHTSELDGGGGGAASLALGAAPVAGLQFRLNERLSISTEAAYKLFFVLNESGGNSRFGVDTGFAPPVALYAQFDF